jgi:hypothetical protein
MLQTMEAEILFLDPNDVSPGSAALMELGFEEVEVLDYVDDYGPTVWIRAKIASSLAPEQFLLWVADIVEPLRGDVVEAGHADPPAVKSKEAQHG